MESDLRSRTPVRSDAYRMLGNVGMRRESARIVCVPSPLLTQPERLAEGSQDGESLVA